MFISSDKASWQVDSYPVLYLTTKSDTQPLWLRVCNDTIMPVRPLRHIISFISTWINFHFTILFSFSSVSISTNAVFSISRYLWLLFYTKNKYWIVSTIWECKYSLISVRIMSMYDKSIEQACLFWAHYCRVAEYCRKASDK